MFVYIAVRVITYGRGMDDRKHGLPHFGHSK
jgi:hypothetical protein